jgi:hypothetical protein
VCRVDFIQEEFEVTFLAIQFLLSLFMFLSWNFQSKVLNEHEEGPKSTQTPLPVLPLTMPGDYTVKVEYREL